MWDNVVSHLLKSSKNPLMASPQNKINQSKAAKRQIRICVASNAGGSGKTTTAVHLAYAIAHRGYRVTIIELDISSSLSTFTGLPMNPEPAESIATVFHPDFAGDYPLKPIWAERIDSINAIQGGEAVERVIREIPLNSRGHYLLQDRLEDYPIASDVILFDTPATLEPMGVVALAASTHVLSPIKPENKDAEGFAGFIRWYFRQLSELRLRPKPEILGFVPNRVDWAETAMHRNFLGLNKQGKLRIDIDLSNTLPVLIEEMGIHCFPAIRQSNYYLNASLERLPLQLYRPGCDAAKDFDPITNKIVELLTKD
jgi:chromosome partitioning protein